MCVRFSVQVWICFRTQFRVCLLQDRLNRIRKKQMLVNGRRAMGHVSQWLYFWPWFGFPLHDLVSFTPWLNLKIEVICWIHRRAQSIAPNTSNICIWQAHDCHCVCAFSNTWLAQISVCWRYACHMSPECFQTDNNYYNIIYIKKYIYIFI